MHFRRSETELRAAVHNAYLLDKYYGVGPVMPACQNLVLRMEEFMKRRYELRRNELKGEVEYRERRSYYYDFFPVTEEVLNTISLHAQAEGLDLWDRDVKRYIYSIRYRCSIRWMIIWIICPNGMGKIISVHWRIPCRHRRNCGAIIFIAGFLGAGCPMETDE